MLDFDELLEKLLYSINRLHPTGIHKCTTARDKGRGKGQWMCVYQ